jgi:hypothetical protein
VGADSTYVVSRDGAGATGLYIAQTCGLDYRHIVSNDTVADILRSRWFGSVVIDVVPFEGCN